VNSIGSGGSGDPYSPAASYSSFVVGGSGRPPKILESPLDSKSLLSGLALKKDY